MAKTQVGELSVKVSADTSEVQKGLKSTTKQLTVVDRQLNTTATNLDNNSKKWASWSSVAVAAASAVGVAMVKANLDAIDSLAKTADKIGATTEELQGLRHAGELTGVSMQTMDMALQRMTRRVAEAAQGTGEAKDALIELGISAEELQQLGLSQQMEVVADAMREVENQSDRVRLAMKLFDSEGVALVNTLGGGSDALREMTTELDNMGLSINRVDAKAVEDANDAILRASAAAGGLSQKFTVELAPSIEATAEAMQGLTDNLETILDVLQVVGVIALGKYTASTVTATAASVKLALAQASTATSTVRLSNGIGGYTTRTVAATGATRAMSVATRGLGAAMSFLGGPVGIAITAAIALASFVDWSSAVEQQEKKTAKAVDEHARSLAGLTTEQLKAQKVDLVKKQAELNAEIKRQSDLNKTLLQDAVDLRGAAGTDYIRGRAEAAADQVELLKVQLQGVQQQLTAIDQFEATGQVEQASAPDGKLEGGGKTKQKDAAEAEAEARKQQEALKLQQQKDAAEAEAEARKQQEALKLQQQKDADKAYISQLQDRYKTEEELEKQKYTREVDALREALTRKSLTQKEFDALSLEMKAEHEARLKELEPNKLEAYQMETIGLLEAMGLRHTSIEEKQLEANARELEMLQQQKEAQQITEEEFQNKSTELKRKSGELQRQMMVDQLQGGLKFLASHSKKVDKAMRAAAVVQATIKGQQAAVDAWQAGMSTGGPWAPAVAAAYAASSIANTASQINKIKSGSKSQGSMSGGSSSGGSSSTPASGVSEQQAAPTANQQVSINLVGGSMYTQDQVRELIGQINEATSDGVELKVAGA